VKQLTLPRNALLIAITINTAIFTLLSILHFYWCFGGRHWYEDVLPTNSKGSQRLNPSATSCFIVASALLSFALITIGNSGLFDKYIKRNYLGYGSLAIATIFLIRAIGDFRFIGFFKKVRTTRFGINDTQIFSPLCLFICLLSLLIFILNRRITSGKRKC